jgi:GMP synthase (glutamine-hydrolysing)
MKIYSLIYAITLLFTSHAHTICTDHTNSTTACKDRILIVDFGSQYSHLIARNIRALGVYCELHPHTIKQEEISHFKPSGIILSGSPASVTDSNGPTVSDAIFNSGCPILGICYGMQLMAHYFGGKVQPEPKAEFGRTCVSIDEKSALFSGIPCNDTIDVWMSHCDQVTKVPSRFKTIAHSINTAIVAIEDTDHNLYGVQFHPEVSHTTYGKQLLYNFLVHICHCTCSWKEEYIIDAIIDTIRTTVGTDQVLLAVSGGVDSTVLAALLHRAIGDQLQCIFVDTGLLRSNEADQVLSIFKQLEINISCVDAHTHFLQALQGVQDPEQKRMIIGREFIRLFEAEAQRYGSAPWLAQGTIYSDVIESAGASINAHSIKSHHNVGGLPSTMKLRLIEPLRCLFKDEVRKIGIQLGLPADILFRHPFPGPGLGIRILGEVKEEYIKTLAHVDAIFIEELRNAALYEKVSQAFAIFIPIKTVGIKGDARCYEHIVALRAVESTDFMTARWASLPAEFLAHVSCKILNEVPGIARVVYDISDKPPATIEWE